MTDEASTTRASTARGTTAPATAPITAPTVARTRGELARGLARLREGGASVAFVPTMGALHEGHRALIARARELADVVVVSIFVNPLQFDVQSDLDHYPRTLDADLETCAAEGVALVFAPSTEVMYPDGPLVTVDAGPMGEVLEGAHRPGHFSGVLTVVTKLFNLVQPQVAVFGEKDAQQLALVRRLVSDLDLPVHVVGLPTEREPDGLARSSRNVRLSPEQRAIAAALPQALLAGQAVAGRGPRAVLTTARAAIAAAPALVVDYVELVSRRDFRPVPEDFTGTALLLAAVRAGDTRLIDNVSVEFAAQVV